MIKIDLESGVYGFVADCLATVISAGTTCIVHAFCNNIIADTQARGGKVGLMKLGRYGLESATMFGVTPNVRIAIDNFAEMYNNFVDMTEAYEEKKAGTQYVEVK